MTACFSYFLRSVYPNIAHCFLDSLPAKRAVAKPYPNNPLFVENMVGRIGDFLETKERAAVCRVGKRAVAKPNPNNPLFVENMVGKIGNLLETKERAALYRVAKGIPATSK